MGRTLLQYTYDRFARLLPKENIYAVSYTHLDVYKRQASFYALGGNITLALKATSESLRYNNKDDFSKIFADVYKRQVTTPCDFSNPNSMTAP